MAEEEKDQANDMDFGSDDFSVNSDSLMDNDDLGASEDGDDADLNSFFEDLSTIDNLEVEDLNTDSDPVEVLDNRPSGTLDDASVLVNKDTPSVAPPIPAQAPSLPKKQKQPSSGRIKKVFALLLLAGLTTSVMYGGYLFIENRFDMPWPIVAQLLETDDVFEETIEIETVFAPLPMEPAEVDIFLDIEPEEPIEELPPPKPVKKPPPPAGQGYGLQVASCMFDECITNYRQILNKLNRDTYVKELKSQQNVVNVISVTTYSNRISADDIVEKINKVNEIDGNAFVVNSSGGYKISMGNFPELSRATAVRDTINQMMAGQVVFSLVLKTLSYRVAKIITGNYYTSSEAQQSLNQLKKIDQRFNNSFLVRR